MLWIVIADIKRMLFFKDTALLKLVLPFSTLSKNLSDNNTNRPPMVNPSAGSNHAMYPKFL